MKTTIKLIATLVAAVASHHTLATTHLSVSELNENTEACYQETQLRERGTSRRGLDERSCSRVIENRWTRDDIKTTALFNRALIRHFNRDLEGASADMERLVKVSPAHAAGHALLAQLKHKSGQLSAALVHYDNAIKLGSHSAHIRKMRESAAQRLAQQHGKALTVQVKPQ